MARSTLYALIFILLALVGTWFIHARLTNAERATWQTALTIYARQQAATWRVNFTEFGRDFYAQTAASTAEEQRRLFWQWAQRSPLPPN